jgi:hypothetical protein
MTTTDEAPSGSPGPPVDLARVVAELEAEVARKRASGELPPAVERDLDLLFARYAPAGATGTDFDALIARADNSWFVDLGVPTASNLPGVALVKRVLRKLMTWYLRFITNQLSAFGHTVVEALRTLGGRVDRIEQAIPGVSPLVASEAEHQAPPASLGAWEDAVVALMTTAPTSTSRSAPIVRATGRVLHGDAGDGAVVDRLDAAGLDVYGVDGRHGQLAGARRPGLDLRPDDTLEHLRKLGNAVLGGLILCGVVERLPLGSLLELVDRSEAVLADGARIVVVSPHPGAALVGGGRALVDADLAPGRPLHPETWQHLLGTRGFRDVEVRLADAPGALTPVPGDDDAIRVLNANLTRLDTVLFPPASFLVTAVRARW